MIIKSHSVPILPSGLSPMQDRLLRCEKHVRLVSAPTGSGKSYAFMRAMLDKNAHVLFIVPTKRLLQNLLEDAREQVRKHLPQDVENGQKEDWVAERVIEWSGNQTREGDGSLKTVRIRQFLAGGVAMHGRVIFAIPEVVVSMISGTRVSGATTVNPFSYLRSFDHIVFDEFHTIDDRSFGLACLLSLLAVTERQAKVSLLSATPIDITGVLERVGVDPADVETIAEDVVNGHPPGNRPIHGNVKISLRNCSLLESFIQSRNAVAESIKAGWTVILIYDSVERLKHDEPSIREALTEVGVSQDRILPINSIDDSERGPGEPRRGRLYRDPRDHDVLICTSSVENGVTFRSTLMFTEAGFGVASFVQRVGRVARGAEDGHVIVSLSENERRRNAWIRPVADVVERYDELSVQEFTGHVLRDVRRELEPTHKEIEAEPAGAGKAKAFYRRASWRGAYWAALFIVAIRREKMQVQKEARDRLYRLSPRVVKFVDAKISVIHSVEVVNDNLPAGSQPHKKWVSALLTSALTYRDIGATIEIVDPNGVRHTVTESFLRRATDVLDHHIESEEEGLRVIHLMSRTLDEEIRIFAGSPGYGPTQRLKLYIPSPIGDEGYSLSVPERDRGTERLNVCLVKEWRSRFSPFIQPRPGETREANDPRVEVMKAATALVETLGRPPLDEDHDDTPESPSFA